MKKKISFLLLTAALLLAGCGGEAVHTSAQAGNAEEMSAAESGAADSDSEEAANQSDPESGEVQEAVGEDETVPETVEESPEDAVEMDEALRTELTEELLAENELDTSVVENAPETKGCSFTLPEAFAESEDTAGMYVTKRYPIDASTICYTELDGDTALQLMTEETFKAQAEESFEAACGEPIEVNVDSFERIRIDGCPAFRILCHYQAGDTEMTQLAYVINADKSYVITYSQTDEYDRMEEYEASAETIHLKF